jgi:hypothetical protein
MWKEARKPSLTTALRSEILKPLTPTLKMLLPVITLQPKRGYSATKYDANAVKSPKTLLRQSGRSYDQKKVRNKTRQTLKTLPPVITLRPEHGYSATIYDASPAKTPKTVRRQFGR